MENRYFALNSDCFLVNGALRGAIYNLGSGDVYSIDEYAVVLIEKCESGIALKGIINDYPKESQLVINRYLENLSKTGLGRFFDNSQIATKIPINQLHSLEFIWLELTVGCNLRCVHCYSESLPSLLGKERMTKNDWVRTAKEAYNMGCRKLQFIGGEPFILKSQLMQLITAVKNIGYEFIEVYTNATLIDNADIQFLENNKVAVAVSVYGSTGEFHDSITRNSGSFNKTITILKKLLARDIRVRVGVIAMNSNEGDIEATVKFLKDEIGVKNVKIDLIRPSGRGCNIELIPVRLSEKHKFRKASFSKCTLEIFRRVKYGHNCFSKEICITASGDVFPCIMERSVSFGNVFNHSLNQILESQIAKRIRNLVKDNIEVCRDCEYRYCCFDCRPKAKGASSNDNFYAKPTECLYNPYSGKWKN